ncbi:FAD-binding oxidoreductase (plasmid) [Herbiconiux sp. KACC 21604]|uniref:NAD(P)/FAD-dependent oxidoreductase n=1 Tax=unclassified Herbiconiux TaxID=2618217 RepID=UPI0020A3CB2C|nr:MULTISPECIES: FAD-binding oxidoreductase [unclassified Herbiconiux]WPO88884.1 FAD-binding oxidoreductase [Herbiconiux sp. KACC 21604]
MPFWLDHPDRPAPRPRLTEHPTTDLVIVGGGYCGLWTAIIAKERDPSRDVILLEANTIGSAASGRNGGFVEASLTHGEENGALHFPKEQQLLERLGNENFAAFAATLDTYDIDAEYEAEPTLTVATEPHHVPELRSSSEAAGGVYLDKPELDSYGASPLYRAGLLTKRGNALVNPAKLVWGLAATAERLGVKIYEHSIARSLTRTAGKVTVHTPSGSVTARSAALATNGFPSLLRRLRLFTVPIYDYVLMTEPLSAAQLEAIGWVGRHGITDSSREFHYYRKTSDNRILFGGYDAIYHRGRKIRAEQDQRIETFERLADHFFSTFPQLHQTRFTHKWGGMIDMSTQLVAFHGSTRDHRIAYSAGYTGLGVCATRFGAETMLDFLEHKDTERTRLTMSRRLPIPIPPEPIATPLIQAMRRAVAKSDANGGNDGLLLKTAGLFGVGFDS